MANEERVEALYEKRAQEADFYYDKYQDHCTLLEGSMLAKVKGGIDPYDVWCLGKQLESYEYYQSFCEESGNTNQLGVVPKVAFDVVTAIMGQSVIPVMASVQPIEEENGVVYFKQVRSDNTRGSQTAGDVVVDPRQSVVTPSGYSSNLLSDLNVEPSVAATLVYAFTLPTVPLRSETLHLYSSNDASIEAKDQGPAKGGDPQVGQLWGNGLSGTVNYITGDVNITFSADPGNGQIVGSWQQNMELAADLPRIRTFLDSCPIRAHVYALKGTLGMLKSFAMRKRFGRSAEDELAADLVAEINREVGGDLIRKLAANAQGNTGFDKTPPANVSYFEHKQTLKDALADAEAVLIGNAGRGAISQIIAGRELAAIMGTLPGFQKLSDGVSLGAHVYGTLDGVTIIRVNEQALLDSKTAVLQWKGPTPWEAACVYSPYMPLTVSDTLPEAPNPLGSMKAAAVWAGTDVLVPNFATKLTMTIS